MLIDLPDPIDTDRVKFTKEITETGWIMRGTLVDDGSQAHWPSEQRAEVGGGGCRGEMAMRWHLLGGCLAPRLEVFDDAWAVLADLPELIDWLRCNNNGKATAEEFSAFLKTIGFEDTTTRYPLNLVAALDGLMAHDVGATDSGIGDEALRKRVKAHLDGMPDGEMMAALSRYAREHFLAESALANGRSIADVAEFVRWLSDRMDIDV